MRILLCEHISLDCYVSVGLEMLQKPDIVSLPSLYRAVLPFIVADLLVLAILTTFPVIALWLPTLVKG